MRLFQRKNRSAFPANLLLSIRSLLITVFLFQDKLLTKLEKNEPELASSQEDEVSKRLLFIGTLVINRISRILCRVSHKIEYFDWLQSRKRGNFHLISQRNERNFPRKAVLAPDLINTPEKTARAAGSPSRSPPDKVSCISRRVLRRLFSSRFLGVTSLLPPLLPGTRHNQA